MSLRQLLSGWANPFARDAGDLVADLAVLEAKSRLKLNERIERPKAALKKKAGVALPCHSRPRFGNMGRTERVGRRD